MDRLSRLCGGPNALGQSYTLNDNGTRHSSHAEQEQPDGAIVTTDTTWAYDALQRLTGEILTSSATGESYANVFAYDLDNNRVKQTHDQGNDGTIDETTTYAYDGNDELITQTSDVTGTTTNAYDPNGSLTTSTNGSNVTTYTYDSRNKMTGFANGSTTAAYVYDDSGDRVQETVNGVTTYYLTDTQNPTGHDQPLEVKSALHALPAIAYLIGDRVFAQTVGQSLLGVTIFVGDGNHDTRKGHFGVRELAPALDGRPSLESGGKPPHSKKAIPQKIATPIPACQQDILGPSLTAPHLTLT